jgi:hypothetical protein
MPVRILWRTVVTTLGAFAVVLALAGPSTSGRMDAEGVTYVPGSTQKVCLLTGLHDDSRTPARYGLEAADRGYSLTVDNRTWFLFGDTRPTPTFKGEPNASTRFPGDPSGVDNDSIASAKPTSPGSCPQLDFVPELTGAVGAYTDPSVTFDGAQLDLRTNETPVAGVEVAGKLYVVFATDNPVDVGRPDNCGGHPGCLGHATRAVMAVLEDRKALTFKGLYDLSKPAKPYGDGAKFVSVAIEPGHDGYLYIWGTAGGTETRASPLYLARLKPANISTGSGIEYLRKLNANGSPVFAKHESSAAALFHDSPDCMGELGVNWNPYVNRWMLLYNCTDNTKPHPRGIWMRTAVNPWGPWSAPQTIFNPFTDHGFCYFIHFAGKCPKGTPNPGTGGTGGDYGPYFVDGWTTGTYATKTRPATSTFYYTIDTWVPYGNVIAKSALKSSSVSVPPPCKGSTCH